eukprot:COSAG01_NODE_55075_length_327_cov_1.583333_1_plen_35_part_10
MQICAATPAPAVAVRSFVINAYVPNSGQKLERLEY